jgi:nucleotide-binding universal stress UspA family protein
MYRRVLLAYDGSREGQTALREGALLAKACDADVFLLSVAEANVFVGLAEAGHASAGAQHEASFQQVLDEGAGRLRALGFQPKTRLITGEPAQEIIAYAREIGADLVVVGRRRRTLLKRWCTESIDAALSDHLTCSVLIGRHEGARPFLTQAAVTTA